jgi:hypothetical protein
MTGSPLTTLPSCSSHRSGYLRLMSPRPSLPLSGGLFHRRLRDSLARDHIFYRDSRSQLWPGVPKDILSVAIAQARGGCQQAAPLAVSLWQVAALGQDGNPGLRCHEARDRRGLSMSSKHCGARLILLIATTLSISPTHAQWDTPLSSETILDPEINPNPFDPRAELRNYFRANVTGGWWASDPTYSLSMFHVLLHAPKGWRGNPVSAAGNLCPDRSHKIWTGLSIFEVQPVHQNHTWSPVICRR